MRFVFETFCFGQSFDVLLTKTVSFFKDSFESCGYDIPNFSTFYENSQYRQARHTFLVVSVFLEASVTIGLLTRATAAALCSTIDSWIIDSGKL